MTDIRRHVPLIVAALRAHVPRIADEATLAEARRAILGDLARDLPSSYIVASGRLADAQGRLSVPLDVIILDATIPIAEIPLVAGAHPLRRALAVVQIAGATDAAAVTGLLADLASVKLLLPPRAPAPADAPRAIPRARLPLGIVCLASFVGEAATPLACARALAAPIMAQPAAARPDHLFVLAERLAYRHPALDGLPYHPHTLGFAPEPDLPKPRTCYVCKARFTRPHLFYAALCPSCGDLNLHKREALADLTGRIALVTGGRVRIGYATAVRLLRAGAGVIVTTRFPRAAARRYAAESDYAQWCQRLAIYGLDLRDLPEVERFASHLRATAPHLDVLINNAAQTVRPAPVDVAALLAGEAQPSAALPPAHAALLGDATTAGFLPTVALPSTSVALSAEAPAAPGSWDLRITDEIDLGEMVEAQVINATAPLLLINRLRLLLRLSPHPDRYIINVTSVEGAFGAKLGTHPHTNMAKAALNMLTHTVAADLAREGIWLNAVDPGWVSPQRSPTGDAAPPALPLDDADAAARVCDPIFTAIATGTRAFGRCFKDYAEVPW